MAKFFALHANAKTQAIAKIFALHTSAISSLKIL